MKRRKFLLTAAGATAALVANNFSTNLAHAQFPALKPIANSSAALHTTTANQPWQSAPVYEPAFDWTVLNLNLGNSSLDDPLTPPLIGFGTCFNELGWKALSALHQADREAILHELFDPHAGARLNFCRMPIAANDYALGPYSYDETPGDFALDHFSIDHDRNTLVPFIKAAQRHQPNLQLWASPWTPPTWMKRNAFYAEAPSFPGMPPNGIKPNQIGHEGEDLFIQDDKYFDAYARYFGKFIDAYAAEAIHIRTVMPQNEFNSAQNFPSCTWTPEGLARFIEVLGPEMEKRDVEIFFGTLERGNPELLEHVLADPKAAKYIRGVGVQWAGKNALPIIKRHHPDLTVVQSEQECGDGKNDWRYTSYCWQLMKHYFRSGVSAYCYWNTATPKGGLSTWGWAQNALVTIDEANKTFAWSPDYYLLKHLSHSVEIGARRLVNDGTADDALAFENPDGSIVVLLRNELNATQKIQINTKRQSVMVDLPADSINTLKLNA